ncbi:MAG: hypothetical protein KC434_09020 [Anaerolineales bacterium]|nr:hypothetical protein [Anaerolineales bacterium]
MKTTEAESNQAIFLQQQIDLYTEELVEMADKTLSQKRMDSIKRDLRTAQLNNLLGVALESPSVAPIRNWVNFQMGRRETQRAWNESGFGEDVLKDLVAIRPFSVEVVNAVFPQADEKSRKRHLSQTYLKMVQLYTGYLKRWFVARGGQN